MIKIKLIGLCILCMIFFFCEKNNFDAKLIEPYLFGNSKLNPDNPSLSYPTNITSSSMTLKWLIDDYDNFVSSKLYYDTIPNVTENSTLITTITNINTNSYTVTGLNSNTIYYFRIYLIDSEQQTYGSNIVYGKTSSIKGVWTLVSQIPDVTFQSLYFTSDTNGYAAGYLDNGLDEGEGIIYHFNGSEWIPEILPDCYGLLEIKFIDSNNGYAVGNYGTLLYFNGTTWKEFDSPVESHLFNSIGIVCPLSNENIWCAEDDDLYHWNGSNWSKYELNVNTVGDIYFINPNDGWLADSKGRLYHYDGYGWSLYIDLELSRASGYYGIFYFSSTSSGWYFDQEAYSWNIFHFDGTTWNEYSEEPFKSDSRHINDISGISASNVWAVGSFGCIYNYNGSKWKSVTSPT
ncbi:MAG: hypothetical protein KAW56_00605, partial [Candidatus Marinimicrobia bacterium]|nr:hypothetical protein [Candidatus Neomarinimicrobiota bacterium]